MDLVTPGFGLIFWTTIAFGILVLLLKAFAWKPILNTIKEREDSIDNALKSAEKAREEMKSLQADNEKILAEARAERDAMMKEGRDLRDKTIEAAKETAKIEAEKIITSAREQIELQKKAAMTELKNQVAALSIDMAEKILRRELSDAKQQEALINELLEDIK
ncbi:MAG: F0F1 ATP synthase subunit B [Flavobacteriales bacterium]|jgi:F-type H+-transporting ATPase subunit b|nr:MAG: F0F1 ATP synthase subunit B [Flavobacteriales bacterium]